MHHYFEAITNTSGDSLVGYFARVIDPATQNTITMSADDNGTPIVTKSGVDNMGSTGDYGNLDFYVAPGTYHLDIYAPNATSFIFRVPSVAMNSSKGDTGDQGPEGPQGEGLAEVMAPTGSALVGYTGPAPAMQPDTVASVLDDTISVMRFMNSSQKQDIRSRTGSIDVTTQFQAALDYAKNNAKILTMPPGVYLVGNLSYGSQNTTDQSTAPLGLVGSCKGASTLKAKPGLTGILLKSWSVAGATFRDFAIDTSGSSAVAWDARWFIPGPSTQNVIEHIQVTVHNNFTDGQTAHVNWDDMNDTYPRGVTVRPFNGVTTYDNCYISMVQSGGLTAMSGCIWTGGFLRFGCQVGEIVDSWGHGWEFAANCLNHVTITGGYPYKNPVKQAVGWSQDFAQNGNSIRSLIINSTELNTDVGTGGCYFDINLLGSFTLNGVEFIGKAVNFFGPNSRGAGISKALVTINGGTHNGNLVLNDVAGIEYATPHGFMNVATSRMVTNNRGGTFTPTIGGTTSDGTASYSVQKGSYVRIDNRIFCDIDMTYTGHSGTGQLLIKGLPFPNAGTTAATVSFALDGRSGFIGESGGQQITMFNYDGAPYGIAPSARIICSFSYQIEA